MNVYISDEYYSVILLTASMFVPCGHKRSGGFVYVQGAADDEEAWSYGLTSTQFWENYKQLLNCAQEDELINLIQEVVTNSVPMSIRDDLSAIGTTNISIGIGNAIPGRISIVCGSENHANADALYLHIPAKSKPLTIMTQKLFPVAAQFVVTHGILNHSRISITAIDLSRRNLDLSISVTLILLCLFFDDHGIFLLPSY
jgi:tRNA A64-2'-O-ribosylphosphate transferase